MNNTIKRLKPESCDLQHNAARKLADDLGILSGLWSQKGSSDGRDFSGDFYLVDVWKKRGNWQIIARYSMPLGKPPERPPLQLPPPEDTDAQLTSVLTQRERELGQLALHGFQETRNMQRLVSAEFTQRVSDAPERSLSRKQWGQPSGAYKVDSLEERYHSARKLSDDLAVVNLVLTQQASFQGQDRSGDFYIVDVWKKTGEGWKIIARYSGPISKKLDR